MASNWPPPFGLPFPPPWPPQNPQRSPADDQNGPANSRQPPPANAFVPPPQPSWNALAHNQNAQQHPPYPVRKSTSEEPEVDECEFLKELQVCLGLALHDSTTNNRANESEAWLPGFPMPEQINQHLSQMQMDMQQLPFMMMQNHPPPIPGLGFPSNPPPQSPFQNPTPMNPFRALPTNPFPPPSAQPNPFQNSVPVQGDRIVEVMDMESDKEDGEVSEGGSQALITNGGTCQETPRSAPKTTARAVNNSVPVRQETYNPDKPAAGQATKATLQPKSTIPAIDSSNTLAQQREDAKAFIRLLHANNIGYHALAAEGLDRDLLRELYRSVNLPSEPEPIPSLPKVNGAVPTVSDSGENGGARPTASNTNGSKLVTTVSTSVPPTKSVPSPAPATSREEYLKRLRAAKKGNQNGGTKVTPPQKTPPPALTASKVSPAPQTVTSSETRQQLMDAEKKAKTTELIRKRIEALKNSSSSPAAAAPSKPPAVSANTRVSSHSTPKAVQASPSTLGASTPSNIPQSPFANIPGLFMNSSPITLPNNAPVTPGSSLRKQSLPSDADASTLQENVVMQENARPLATQVKPTQNGHPSIQPMPVTSGPPSRPASVNPPASGISTPGPQTPSSTARSQELDDKARKQAALKERLQKKIEEQKRESERRLAKNSPKATSHQTQALPTPKINQEASGKSKQRRKADVEAEQTALESEIAENAARLAQIAKELESLTANDAKLRRDKERLQAELESLGIDTEGMPHAELQARKEELEREQEAVVSMPEPTNNLPTKPGPAVQMSTTVTPATQPALVNVESAALPMSRLVEPPTLAHPSIPGLNASSPLARTSFQPPKTQNTAQHEIAMHNGRREDIHHSEPFVPKKPSTALSEAGAMSNDLNKPTTPLDDEEDFYSPEPANVLSVRNLSERADSPSEEGEMAMSESEEEYEPEEAHEAQISEHAPVHVTAEQNTTLATSLVSPLSPLSSPLTSSIDDEDESYEPPDADQQMRDVESSAEPIENDLITQQRDIGEEEMDISIDTSSGDDSDSDNSESLDQVNDNPSLALNSKDPDSSMSVANGSVSSLQPEALVVPPAPRNPEGSSVTQDVVYDTLIINSTNS